MRPSMRKTLLLCTALSLPLSVVGSAESDPRDAVRRLIDDARYSAAVDAARELLAAAAAPGPDSNATADALELLVEAMVLNSDCRAPGCVELAQRALRLRVAAL